MTYESFVESINSDRPPDGVSGEIQALWHDRNGDWDRAHRIVQQIKTTEASAVHAYLHREEGDLGNAGYWYSRAGREKPTLSLEDEWSALARELL